MHQITRTAITISYMTSCSPFSVQLRNREASPISVFPRRSRPTLRMCDKPRQSRRFSSANFAAATTRSRAAEAENGCWGLA